MTKSTFANLRKFVAPEFIFGNDSRQLVANYSRNFAGQRIFLVTDYGVENAGWAKEISEILSEDGFEIIIYNTVSPNPRDYEVMQGAELYKEKNCDVIVGIGGGSVLDCAKGIAIVATNGGNILDYEGVDKVQTPMPPIICIPTTAGTSADVSQFAIINNTEEKVKIAIISKSLVPDLALIDPVTLLTMPEYLTACTGMDALVHAVEAFVSNSCSAMTDLHSFEAIRLISKYLYDSVHQPDNLDLRNQIMQASLQAGLAFSNASLGCVHSMAHSLGGFLDLPHGECNAILLPHVVDFNFTSNPEKYKKIANVFNLEIKNKTDKEIRKTLVDFFDNYRKSLKILDGLSARGVNHSNIKRLAEKAFRDPCNATNPKYPNLNDLETVYKEAL